MKVDRLPYELPACQSCEAVGTIVELGVCCKVRELNIDFQARRIHEAQQRLCLPPRRRTQ